MKARRGRHNLTSSDTLLLYRSANGNLYKISILVLWASNFDLRTAADEEIKRRSRDVHVVESALATAMGVHSVEGSRTTVFHLAPASARFKPCNVADPLSAMQTMATSGTRSRAPAYFVGPRPNERAC